MSTTSWAAARGNGPAGRTCRRDEQRRLRRQDLSELMLDETDRFDICTLLKSRIPPGSVP